MKFSSIKIASVILAAALTSHAAFNPGNLPLWFEATDNATFTTRSPGAEFAITRTGAEITLQKSGGQPATVRMNFVGGNTGVQLHGDHLLAGKINHFIGNDATQWRSGLATFSQVRLENIYPGVNVIYYGNAEQLEYDFNLAAGVNPETITLRFDGAEKISVDAQGQLVLQVNGGQIIQHPPVAYQIINGERHAVAAGYKITDAHTAAFVIGSFDHSQPLVIDPVLGYASYFGGNFGDIAWAVAINPVDNSIYLAGQTFSTQISNGIPFAKNGAFTNYNGGVQAGDAFVAKFDSTGTNLLYCTYLGGSVDDAAYAIAVDPVGHAFVAGATVSSNFPVLNAVTNGAYNGSHISGVKDPDLGYFSADAFVTELETNGASLIYSTYLGGASTESGFGIAIDAGGNAFVTGDTYSTNFPVTGNALMPRLACVNNPYYNANAFVVEIAAGGQHLNYSSFLGGTNLDIGHAIAYKNGRVFVSGSTTSTNFPWVNGLNESRYLNGRTNLAFASDGFVAMFTTSGTNLLLQYSTFLGSTNDDVATGIAADSSGNAYVVGWTVSTNFPNSTTGVALTSSVRTNTTGFAIWTNAFLSQITLNNGSNAVLGFSRTFGGRGMDIAEGVALDATGNIFVTGSASSPNFPTTAANIFGSLRATNSGSGDAFLTIFKSDFSALVCSAYLGGKQADFGNAIAVDNAGDAWITGQTLSTNFPVFNAYLPKLNGTSDAFLAKISVGTGAPALAARRVGTNALVFWPPVGELTPALLGLETVTNLISTNWTVITNPAPVLTNGNYIYTFNPTNPVQFFRFHKF